MTRLALVCSSGGHLFQLYSLKKYWQGKERFWVSFPTLDAKALLGNERLYLASYPTNRNVKSLAKNIFLAIQLLTAERPQVIISTGAGVAVPFLIVGKFLGIKTIYLESITRSSELSLSGYLVYPFVDTFLVQWPELARKYRRAEYQGRIL